MSSAPPVENFKGNSWEECDDFILAIHKRAFWEGKQRDSGWMADFAATNFSRKARLWHSRLPEDVRHDWSKLEIALLERWSPPEDDDEPQIEPNPAAAPLPNRSKTADRPLEGLLKVVLDESNTSYYVRFDDSVCNLTTDASEAIRVRCNSVLGVTLLERTNNSSHSWLAVHWCSYKPNIEKGSAKYAWRSSARRPLTNGQPSSFARVSLVDRVSLKSSRISNSPFQLISGTILDNGEVVPVWTKDDTSETTLFVMTYGNFLYLVADPEAFARAVSGARRGKFFVEPTD